MPHNIAASTTALSVHLSLGTAAITQHIPNRTQPISHRTSGITHGITQIAAPVLAFALIATKAAPEPAAAMVELPIVADTIRSWRLLPTAVQNRRGLRHQRSFRLWHPASRRRCSQHFRQLCHLCPEFRSDPPHSVGRRFERTRTARDHPVSISTILPSAKYQPA
jgi:hypothetical protein